MDGREGRAGASSGAGAQRGPVLSRAEAARAMEIKVRTHWRVKELELRTAADAGEPLNSSQQK